MARKKVDATSMQQMSVIDIEKLVGVQSLFPESNSCREDKIPKARAQQSNSDWWCNNLPLVGHIVIYY